MSSTQGSNEQSNEVPPLTVTYDRKTGDIRELPVVSVEVGPGKVIEGTAARYSPEEKKVFIVGGLGNDVLMQWVSVDMTRPRLIVHPKKNVLSKAVYAGVIGLSAVTLYTALSLFHGDGEHDPRKNGDPERTHDKKERLKTAEGIRAFSVLRDFVRACEYNAARDRFEQLANSNLDDPELRKATLQLADTLAGQILREIPTDEEIENAQEGLQQLGFNAFRKKNPDFVDRCYLLTNLDPRPPNEYSEIALNGKMTVIHMLRYNLTEAQAELRKVKQ